MKTRTEEFVKKNVDKKDKTIIRRLIQEEEFQLNLEEIERMEKNANIQIVNANQVISEMNKKLTECQKLRKLL